MSQVAVFQWPYNVAQRLPLARIASSGVGLLRFTKVKAYGATVDRITLPKRAFKVEAANSMNETQPRYWNDLKTLAEDE